MNKSQKLAFVTFLTFVRVPLVFIFFGCAISSSLSARHAPWLFRAAFSCLILAAASDAVDGFFARKFKVASKFGACADPLTDKVFYVMSLPLLVFLSAHNGHTEHSVVLLCLAALLLLRDQWVSFMRSLASGYDVSLGANWSGKARTAMGFPLICLLYYAEGGGGALNQSALYAAEAVVAAINVVSIWVYTNRYWPYVKSSMRS